jgi:hypothetical protein
MRRSGILIWSVVVALLLGVGTVSFAASTGSGVDPAVAKWSGWPGRVSCGGLPFKPLVTFSRPTGVERAHGGPETALREFLGDPRLAYLGARAHGWRLLAARPSQVEFANGSPSRGPIQIAEVVHRRRGWKWVGWSGGCTLAVLRGHNEALTWKLAPGQHPRPSTRAIKVTLEGGSCGGPLDERLERPSFREENGALLVALWAKPEGGFCPGFFEPPVTIHLPHPLGQLRLMDGGVFPPRPARPGS